jgi:hypothetical protein
MLSTNMKEVEPYDLMFETICNQRKNVPKII